MTWQLLQCNKKDNNKLDDVWLKGVYKSGSNVNIYT